MDDDRKHEGLGAFLILGVSLASWWLIAIYWPHSLLVILALVMLVMALLIPKKG